MFQQKMNEKIVNTCLIPKHQLNLFFFLKIKKQPNSIPLYKFKKQHQSNHLYRIACRQKSGKFTQSQHSENYKRQQIRFQKSIIRESSKFPRIMQQKDRETQQLLRQITEANKTIDEWAQLFGDRLLEEVGQEDQGLIDMGKLTFQEETALPDMIPQRQSFFSQIPLLTVDEQTQQKILKFNLNFVSTKRKDELFKRHRKEQEEKLMLRKRQMEKQYSSPYTRMDNLRNIKGEFTLKRGEQAHTCSITGDDLQKLKPETDLNDTIIANYLKYLQTEVFTQQTDNQIFIFSSFFFEKLVGQMLRQDLFFAQKDIKNLNEKMRLKVAQNYKNIKRWTRRTDIFEKEYLIIPINAFKHWYCVIVAHPGALIKPQSTKRPYIINCDSMFEKKFFIIDAIRMYLQVELQDKKSIKLQITESNFPSYQLLLPRQTNTHDCGLYMLSYIEHLLSNKEELENLHIVKNREKLNIFPRAIIYTMRERLKELFINLIQSTDEQARREILLKYKQQNQKIISSADENDYDHINEKEFRKYSAINSYLLETSGYNINQLSDEELQFACKIRFYLDPEVNYYERDRQFMMF